MKLEERMYAETDLDTLVSYASHPEWHLDKAHALYELALRATEDKSLLPLAWKCIGSEITFAARQGPPLGQPAAVLLVDSGMSELEESLSHALGEWTSTQQADFLLGVYAKDERKPLVDRLAENFGFVSKVKVSEAGEVSLD